MAFTCPTCGGEFDSQAALDEHSTEHGSTHGSFRCPMCGGEFDSQAALDEHTKVEHPA
jgi:transcription elongation factor Elf1